MKPICALLASCLALIGLLPAATPAAVGSISEDVGFSEGMALGGGFYRGLEQRHLSDYPDKVIVLAYFTPG